MFGLVLQYSFCNGRGSCAITQLVARKINRHNIHMNTDALQEQCLRYPAIKNFTRQTEKYNGISNQRDGGCSDSFCSRKSSDGDNCITNDDWIWKSIGKKEPPKLTNINAVSELDTALIESCILLISWSAAAGTRIFWWIIAPSNHMTVLCGKTNWSCIHVVC